MSGQTLLATFGPLVVAAILVAIGIFGSFQKSTTRTRLEGVFIIAAGLLYLAFIVWAIASQRWGIALALSGSFVLFGWNRWRGRYAQRPMRG